MKKDVHFKLEAAEWQKLHDQAEAEGKDLGEYIRTHLTGNNVVDDQQQSNPIPWDEGTILQVQTYKKGGSKILVERRDLFIQDLKAKELKLKVNRDKRAQEMHEVDIKLKEKKLANTPGVTTSKHISASVSLPCPIEPCPIPKTVTFRDYAALQDHYRENHPERIVDRTPGHELNRWTGR